MQGILSTQREADRQALERDAIRSRGGVLSDTPSLGLTGSLMQDPADRARQERQVWEATVNMMPIAGIMAGVGSKTANMLKLKQAQELAEQGAKREKIWNETGWFKDVDGQWKYEIDDSGAREFASGGQHLPGYEGNLSDVLHHQHGYTAYPDTNKITFESVFGDGGGYIPYVDHMQRGMSSKTPNISKTLHELQHAIQHREKFAQGGNPSGPYPSGERAKLIERKINEISKHPANQGDSYDAIKGHAEKFVDSEYGRMEGYRRLAGEAEARNVQTRMDFTPAERMAKPPWTTLDVPEDELLVRGVLGGK